MSHLILHIGTHKTGSTALQNTLWRHARYLQQYDIVYPRLHARHSGHHGLIAEATRLPAAYHLPNGGDHAMRKLAGQLENSGQTLVLSSEEFSRADPDKRVDFHQVASIFGGFDQISVVCALRPQWRFLQAIYLEISRKSSPPRPPDYVAEALETGQCRGLHMDYLDLLARLGSAFGETNLRFIDFEQARQRPDALLETVLGIAGCSGVARDLLQGDGLANVSANPIQQWAANLLAEPYASPPELNLHVASALKRYAGPRPTCLLTRSEISQLKARFSGSNAKLIDRVGRVQPDFALTDPEIPENTLFREDVGLEFWLECGRAIFRPRLTDAAE